MSHFKNFPGNNFIKFVCISKIFAVYENRKIYLLTD